MSPNRRQEKVSSISADATPEFDQADRMRKSLRVAGQSVGEMAEYLGVTRETASRWINGRGEPSIQTLRLWAARTGVSYEWLKDGAQ